MNVHYELLLGRNSSNCRLCLRIITRSVKLCLDYTQISYKYKWILCSEWRSEQKHASGISLMHSHNARVHLPCVRLSDNFNVNNGVKFTPPPVGEGSKTDACFLVGSLVLYRNFFMKSFWTQGSYSNFLLMYTLNYYYISQHALFCMEVWNGKCVEWKIKKVVVVFILFMLPWP